MTPEQASWLLIAVLSFPGILLGIYILRIIKKRLTPVITKEQFDTLNNRLNSLERYSEVYRQQLVTIDRKINDIESKLTLAQQDIIGNRMKTTDLTSNIIDILHVLDATKKDINQIEKDMKFYTEV